MVVKLLNDSKMERAAWSQQTARTLDALQAQMSTNSRALQRFENDQRAASGLTATNLRSLSDRLTKSIHDKAETDANHLNHIRSIASYVDSIREQLGTRSK